MRNYMKADLSRIFKRVPRIITMLFLLAIDVVVFWNGKKSTNTGVDIANVLTTILKWLPAVIGFIEIGYVFGDDFKGKTAQIAIGIGVSRRAVVICKWLEMIILGAIDTLVIIVVAVLTTSLTGVPIPSEMAGEVTICGVMAVLSVAGYTAMVLPVFFMAQGVALGNLVYLLLSTQLFMKLVGYIGSIQKIAWMHLSNYTLSNCLNVLRSRLILGSLHYESLLGIAVYIVLYLIVTVRLYRKLELEF